MTSTPSKATAGLRRRKDDLVKPDHLTFDQWLFKIENERAEINRQVRREVHTRGFVHAKYCERLDRAIILARAAISRATGEAPLASRDDERGGK